MDISNEQKIDRIPNDCRDAVILRKYGELFLRVRDTDILPVEECSWSPEALAQTMDTVFTEYGQKALDANDGKIFMTLSGGLDSTLALAILRKSFPTAEIITFTMGGTVDHPDVIHARMAAEKFGSTHHEYIPNENEMAGALIDYAAAFPEHDPRTSAETGDMDVYMLYRHISEYSPKVLLAYDGIDELMGGYWEHRENLSLGEKEDVYMDYWKELLPKHLVPLTTTSNEFGIDLLFPYLDPRIVNTISDIQLADRSSRIESKKPLRAISRKLGVPKEILIRPKRGQVGMLDLT